MKNPIGAAQDKYMSGLKAWRTGMDAYSTGYRIINLAKSQFGYTVSIPAQDWLYDEVHAWLLNTVRSQGKRKVRATIAYTGRVTSHHRMYGIDDSDVKREVRFFSDDNRTQKVVVDGHKVEVSLLKADHTHTYGMNLEVAKSLERIQFTCFSASARDAVINLLNELVKQKTLGDRQPRFNIVSRWGDWQDRADVSKRTRDSVILREGQADALFADVDQFLKAENEYVKRCLPYHRGYLLYGPPGSGKTSIVKALATEFKLDLWYLPLGDISKDTNLLGLINQVDARSILLLEDIDVFQVAHNRDEDDKDGGQEVSLSGILNALDGVATPHGLITVMTTNDHEVLDEALVRTGRIDRSEFIDYADDFQANELFKFFYGDYPNKRLRVQANTSPSDILEIFKRHLSDPATAERIFHETLSLHAAA